VQRSPGQTAEALPAGDERGHDERRHRRPEDVHQWGAHRFRRRHGLGQSGDREDEREEDEDRMPPDRLPERRMP
jgi:hypothetical protein